MGLIDIFGNGHQSRHRTKRHTLEVHIQTGADNTDTALRQLLAYINNAHVEELRLINTHYIDIVGQQQDVLARINGRGLNDIPIMTHHVFFAIAYVNGGFKNLHAQFREFCAFHTANQLFSLAAEHRSAYYFNRSAA